MHPLEFPSSGGGYRYDQQDTNSQAQQQRQVPLPVSHWVNLLQDEKDFYQDTVNLILDAIGPKAILEYLRKKIT